ADPSGARRSSARDDPDTTITQLSNATAMPACPLDIGLTRSPLSWKNPRPGLRGAERDSARPRRSGEFYCNVHGRRNRAKSAARRALLTLARHVQRDRGPRREQQVRAAIARLIADSEIDRGRRLLPKQLGELRLIVFFKNPVGAIVAPECGQTPFRRVEACGRNARVVLDDRGAGVEDETSDAGKLALVQKIRRALEQAVGTSQPPAELKQSGTSALRVGEIGGEVVQNLPPPVRSSEDDLDASRRSPAARPAEQLQLTAPVQIDEPHGQCSLCGTREANAR